MRVLFKPFRELLLCEPIAKAEEVAGSGLVLPGDSQLDKTKQVRVLAVGPKVENKDIVPGAILLVNRMADATLRIGNQFFLILHENEILGQIGLAEEAEEKQVVTNHG